MQERLENARREEEAASRELSAAQYELETAQGQRRQAEDEVLRLEGARSHYEILLRSLEESLENLDGELESLSGRLADNAARAQRAEETVRQQEEQAAQFRRQAEEVLAGQSELLAQSGQLAEEISGQKARVAALAAERDSTARRVADLRQVAQELSGDRSQKEQTVRSYQDKIDAAEQEIQRRRETMARLTGTAQVVQERLRALNEEKITLEAQRTAQNKESQEKNENLLNLERWCPSWRASFPLPPWRKSRFSTGCGSGMS